MTLWELAPFQVRSSVFEIESYLMWFQKGKGKLRHWIWVGEIVPLGWQEEPGWAGGTKQGTRVHTHTCTHTPWGYWLACINSPAMLEKKKKTTFCAEYSACVYCCYSQTQILVTGNITNMSEEATVPLEVLKACVARFRVSISKD